LHKQMRERKAALWQRNSPLEIKLPQKRRRGKQKRQRHLRLLALLMTQSERSVWASGIPLKPKHGLSRAPYLFLPVQRAWYSLSELGIASRLLVMANGVANTPQKQRRGGAKCGLTRGLQ
jgi:hypothetical protein